MTTRRWVDWVNVMLGAWLISSPWLFGMAAGDSSAAWSSWSMGAGIAMLALIAMLKPSVTGDAAAIMVGAWLMASPWMLGFSDAAAATANAIIIGLLVIGYALWAARIDLNSGDGAAYMTRQRGPA